MADTVSYMRVESGRKRGEGVKSYPKKWGKLFERYLDEYLPERKDEICARADNVRPLSLSSIYKEARAALEIADIIFKREGY